MESNLFHFKEKVLEDIYSSKGLKGKKLESYLKFFGVPYSGKKEIKLERVSQILKEKSVHVT